MKTIGHTGSGEVIVTITEAEMNAFERLANVAQGKSMYSELRHFGERFDADMVQPLTAAIDWMMIQDKAGALRAMAQEIEQKLQRGS